MGIFLKFSYDKFGWTCFHKNEIMNVHYITSGDFRNIFNHIHIKIGSTSLKKLLDGATIEIFDI